MSPASAQAIHYSSKSEEWYTPAPIIEAVIEALGGIDIDPCSNSHGAPNVPAAAFYIGENIKEFDLAFNEHGKIWVLADRRDQA